MANGLVFKTWRYGLKKLKQYNGRLNQMPKITPFPKVFGTLLANSN
jgi:hypothetical protein